MRTPLSFERYLQNQKASLGIVAALFLPVMIGMIALGAEASAWRMKQVKLSQTADAIAFTAALQKRDGFPDDEILRRGHLQAYEAGLPRETLDVSISFREDGSAAVVLTEEQDRYFSRMFFKDSLFIGKSAAAKASQGSSGCLIALNAFGSAIQFDGSTSVRLKNCVAASNSASEQSIERMGSATIDILCLMAVGKINGFAPADTECEKNLTGIAPLRDPLEKLAEPLANEACYLAKRGRGQTEPDTYAPGWCEPADLKGDIILSPGVYVFDQDVHLSGGSVKGTDITLVFRNGAGFRLNGNASLDLAAPKSGPLKDILIFGRSAGDFRHNGTSDIALSGIIYFPHSLVEMNGNSSDFATCMRIIGRDISFRGSSTFDSTCVGGGPGKDDLIVNSFAKVTG